MTQNILIIDDSPDIHELLDLRLPDDSLAKHHALDAAEGLARARELRPDLILLDVVMPDRSGFSVCRELKEDPATAPIPVIFLTGTGDTFNKVQGLDLGAVDYVTKPFDPAELQARVRAALRTKRYGDMLAEKALVDALTGLRNRAYFNERLATEVAATRRHGRPVSLLMFDIDHFKKLNDTYGHPFGDHVLHRVGEYLLASARAADAMCRYGGEEFAVILPETETEAAAAFGRRLLEGIAALPFSEMAPSHVTASAGLACTTMLTDDELSPEFLIEAADAALYSSKRSGRNRLTVARFEAQDAQLAST